MITCKKEYKLFIKNDLLRYSKLGNGEKIFKEFNFYIRIFIKKLRLCEYLKNSLKEIVFFRRIRYFFAHKRMTKISNMFNIVVPLNSCDFGLLIYHPNVIINGLVGKNATFHGNNCIGEKNGLKPTICDNVEFGFGAVAIGEIIIENECIIGSCAFINYSCPAKTIAFSENKIVFKRYE